MFSNCFVSLAVVLVPLVAKQKKLPQGAKSVVYGNRVLYYPRQGDKCYIFA